MNSAISACSKPKVIILYEHKGCQTVIDNENLPFLCFFAICGLGLLTNFLFCRGLFSFLCFPLHIHPSFHPIGACLCRGISSSQFSLCTFALLFTLPEPIFAEEPLLPGFPSAHSPFFSLYRRLSLQRNLFFPAFPLHIRHDSKLFYLFMNITYLIPAKLQHKNPKRGITLLVIPL